MKEKIFRKIKGKDHFIGNTSMMAPTSNRESNRIFKMLRLVPNDSNLEGDIFFFEFDREEWVLLHEFGFINPLDPQGLLKIYNDIQYFKRITFEEFIDKLINT